MIDKKTTYAAFNLAPAKISKLNKVFGIISYLPDKESDRIQRIVRLEQLLDRLHEFWRDVPIMIIAQNWKEYLPKNDIIKYAYDKLGILTARKMLRKHFLESKYDYLIMFDDDAIIECEDKNAPKLYMAELDKYPNGFCFIYGGNNKYNPYVDSQLNLCAISRYIYEKEDMVNIDAQKSEGFEDRVFSLLLHVKYSEYEFLAPTTIRCTHFKNPNIDKYGGEVPSTWANNQKYNWLRMRENTLQIEQYILKYKELPDLKTLKMTTVICVCAKNENLYINEWCKHYLKLGVSRIYIFDNNDFGTDYVGNVFDEEIKDKITIFDKRGATGQNKQLKFCTDFYSKYNKTFDWCFFIDADEFLTGVSDINEWLSNPRFKNFEMIRIKWNLFGDDEMITRDTTVPVYKAFKNIIEGKALSNQGKCIVKGNLENINVGSAHYASRLVAPGTGDAGNNKERAILTQCLPSGAKCNSAICIKEDYSKETIFLNHYMTKTLSEFINQKYARGDCVFEKRVIDFEYFWRINKKTKAKLDFIEHFKRTLNKQSKTEITAYWWDGEPNAGDYYSKWLLDKITGPVTRSTYNPDVICCGSILGHKPIGDNTKIWGAGFHNLDNPIISTNMDNYYAVRGKLTYEKLNTSKKIVLGDPGLLLSKFYKSTTNKKYKYGLITHFHDYAFVNTQPKLLELFHVINMNTNDVDFIVNEIDSCEFIFSSSLHGIIFAHSLGIPAVHLEFTPIESKDNFKFKDYYSVLDIEYSKEVYNKSTDFLNLYADVADYVKYVPSRECVNKIQEDLLNCFPPLTRKQPLKSVNSNAVDIVVLYVDSNDVEWQKLYNQYAPISEDVQVTGKQRFRSNSYFKYWFRGLEKYAPWINNVFLVVQSYSQVPKWINRNTVKIVLHEDFIPQEYLPVFNSQAIEMFLHKIPDLSEKFLYSNDDMYFVGDLTVKDFFENNKVKTSFNRCKYGSDEDMPLWKRASINSGMLVNKNETEKLKQEGSYITPMHVIRPYFKSKIAEVHEQYSTPILESISKFRENKNFTIYLYDFYLKSLGLTVNKNYSSTCFSSTSSISLVCTAIINPHIYKTICINDTVEIEDKKRIALITEHFDSQLSTLSKYEVLK